MNDDTPDQPLSTETTNDEAMVRLLRTAGPRSLVPRERNARVRVAVHREWQAVTRRRIVRRRALAGSMAILAAAAASALILMVPDDVVVNRPAPSRGKEVAVVDRVEGTPQLAADASLQPGRLSSGDRIHEGQWIETGGHARVAMRFDDGTSVRLDVASRARVISASQVELSAGGIYVDTDRQGGFEVLTRFATARDVGTQFEVRLHDRAVRLRVRSGMVELRDGARLVSGRAGSEVTLSASGAESRPIPLYGPDWAWTAGLAPRLEIEGVPLDRFLADLSREHGWTLHYADPKLAREASTIVLHGSVDGLAPREALRVAVLTSGLRHRLEDGELVVLRGTESP
jgi:ferric-dicitrate binding protein FerR (iron transport regulator)